MQLGQARLDNVRLGNFQLDSVDYKRSPGSEAVRWDLRYRTAMAHYRDTVGHCVAGTAGSITGFIAPINARHSHTARKCCPMMDEGQATDGSVARRGDLLLAIDATARAHQAVHDVEVKPGREMTSGWRAFENRL